MMAEQEVNEVTENVEDMKIEDDVGLTFPGKKKKKKKKTDISEFEDIPAENDDHSIEPLPLDATKKKKRKGKGKPRPFDWDAEVKETEQETGNEVEETVAGKYPWSGTDRDYTYEELLDRVYKILHENNPELTGERKRISMKAPQVVREGTKKTVFLNFAELCKAFNRNLDHVMQFVIFELGTTGSLDGQQRLVVKGRFNSHNFETVLRAYIVDYVLCDSCKSLDTLLDRDSATRLMHLRCQQCGASKTVQAVKSGFVAIVGRRPR